MANWYLDTSVALHAIIPGGNHRAQTWIEQTFQNNEPIFSSTLLRLEISRALRRENLDLSLAWPLLDRVNLLMLDDGVITVATTIEPHVRSLDAIHLASCSLLGFDTTIVSHDTRMREVAKHLGIESIDPLDPD